MEAPTGAGQSGLAPREGMPSTGPLVDGIGTTAHFEPDRSTPRRGHPGWTLAAVAFGLIMVGLDATVVAVANPAIARSLHGSLSDLQWITNSYLLVLGVTLIPMGMLGDRFGRRMMFLIGIGGFAAASLAVGLIGSISGVIAFRAVQGLFGAMIFPNTLAILRNAFSPETLNRAMGVWGGASAVSVAAGPIVGGLLVEHVSWQSVFYINVPVGALAVLLGAAVLVESRDTTPRPADLLGLVLLAGGLFCVVFGLVRAETWGWGDPAIWSVLAAGGVLLAVLSWVESKVEWPLVPTRLFSSRSLTLGTAAVTFAFFAMFGVLFFMTLFLENVRGYDPVAAGVRLLPLTATFAVAAPLGAGLNERFGPHVTIPAGMTCLAGAAVLLTWVQPDSSYAALWPSFALVGAGMGVVMVAASDAIVAAAPAEEAGIAGGIQSTGFQLGGVLGTSVLGAILSSRAASVFASRLSGLVGHRPLAQELHQAAPLVSQGFTPHLANAGAGAQTALTVASRSAFVSGIHVAFVVAAGVCAATGLACILIKQPGQQDGSMTS